MTQVLDRIITDDPKKAQGALNDGYMMSIQPFVLSEADFNPCCFPTGVIIYILHKIKEKRPEDPMWLVDNEVPYQMTRSKDKWKELFDGDYIGLWETSKNRKGEFDYVIYSHKHTQFFTPKEFWELAQACKEAVDKLFKPNGDCYR